MKFRLRPILILCVLTTLGCASVAPPNSNSPYPSAQTSTRTPASPPPALKCWFDGTGSKTTPNAAKALDGHGGATTLITRNSAVGTERCQASYLDRGEGRDSTLQLMGSVRDGPTTSSVMITPSERSGYGIDSVLTMGEGLLCSCRVE